MKKSITTIEINDHYIKLLEAKWQRGGPCLTYCDIQPKEQGSPTDVLPVLSRMAAAKELILENVFLIIPRRYIFLKPINLPTHSDEELQRMIPLQLSHWGPFTRDEVIYDYSIIEKNSSGYAKILLAVIQKEIVTDLLKTLQKVKLSCQKVVLTSEGLCAWLKFQQQNGRISSEAPLMFIDIGAHASEICFFNRDRLEFARNIQRGTADLAQGKVMSFVEAIGLTFGAYKKEMASADIAKIVIVSPNSRASILKEALGKYYSCPVESAAPLDGITCDKKLAVPVFCQEQGVSLTAGTGFCLSPESAQISLIPTDVIDKKRIKAQKKVIVKFVSVFALTMVLAGGVLAMDIFRKEAHLRKIEEKISEITVQVKKAENKIKFLEFARREKQNRVFIADVIRGLYQITPEAVSHRALVLDAQGVFEIQAYADTQASINQMQNNLVNSMLFGDVTLQYATKRKRFKEEYMEFKITCRLQVNRSSHGQ